MSFIFVPNLSFHCQMDFDSVFEKIDKKTYENLDDLLERFTHYKDRDLFYFNVSPDDKTIGYNLLLAKYPEPYEYKIGVSRSKIVKYEVLGGYSMDAGLNLPAATDATREELGWTIRNANVGMLFSKWKTELYEECGTVYRWKLEKGSEKDELWGEINKKYWDD